MTGRRACIRENDRVGAEVNVMHNESGGAMSQEMQAPLGASEEGRKILPESPEGTQTQLQN